ncbi:hypothetical protein [Paenibacillus sp. MMS18-CY102]|uniref:hypothetical protein n=1 Tax=Paenibacillus sp. MMS18-CY102 TaxID=2682849 RepID=UPI001365501C|nr:hypothetical protein [Paenibacillus sp. MMS18-CY102]MWC26644.1 hypothetical protein [Paenibacillus sp. MMS18-CY102]
MSEDALTMLIEEVSARSRGLSKMAVKNYRNNLILKVTTILLGSIVTGVLALSPGDNGKNIAIVITSVITVVTSIDTLINYQARYTDQLEFSKKMFQLLRDMRFYAISRQPSEYKLTEIEEFKDRYLHMENEFNIARAKGTKEQNGTKPN